MIRLVTDSASMIPPALRDRFDVAVVPMTVTLDGHEHHEGVDLDDRTFFDRLAAGATVTTSAPSPGAVLAAYQHAAGAGATAVLSIHTGSAYSATVSAATIAAGMSPIPVTVVDTGLASFPVALCVWAAADALAAGADVPAAADAARATAAATGSVFVVGVPDLARRGGRFTALDGPLAPTSVLELGPSGLVELTRVDDVDAALDTMAHHVATIAAGHRLRAGVGDADRPELAAALIDRLTAIAGVVEVVHYGVGPSVAAHTGAGTIGVVYCPVASA